MFITLRDRPRSERRINSATPSTVRDVNRAILLNLIRQHQPISRVHLSDKTGIFRSSVSAIVDELLGEKLLIEERSVPKGRGRVPIFLSLNPAGLRVLGISMRRFQTRVTVAGLTGQPENTIAFSTPSDPASWIKELGKAVKVLRGKSGEEYGRAGVSVPGLVNGDTGQLLLVPAQPEYAGFAMAEEVGKLLGVPVTVDNDAKAGALAELWLNEIEVAGVQDFVLVHVAEFGVGAGLIFDGELYSGHDRTWVGEFGHMIVDSSGPQCACGRRGCWELFVSDRSTWRRFDPTTEFTPARFDSLVELALEGDAKATSAFRATAEYLSLGLSNIMFSLNPQRIVIAGELTRVWSLIQQTVESAYSAGDVRVRAYPARFGVDALALQGAVVLALRSVFAQPKTGFTSV